MVTRTDSTYLIHTRAGVATVSTLIPYEDRVTSNVTRWECQLALTRGDFTLFEDFRMTPDGPFKPLAQYTKLDLQKVLETLARSPQTEQFLTRFETVYAQVPNDSFLVSQLSD